jgi:hypothetical protein
MTWHPYGKLTPLLKAFRSTDSPGNLLAMECFLLIADKPRTMVELEAFTGCTNGRINRAVRTLTPWFNPETGEVVRPRLHLIQRRRIICGRGHRLHITAAGRKLLEG